MTSEPLPDSKSFANLWEGLRESGDALGDIKLAGFIQQHWFAREPVSVASIGIPSKAEFLALNALVDSTASLVILGTDPSPEYRSRLNELNNHPRFDGFEIRTQIADLTLPGRWSKLLTALAVKHVGLLGIDARWTLSEPKFWEDLRLLVQSSEVVVYIRRALDFEHSHISVGLLRSMPANSGVEIIAATPSSIWLASESNAGALREELKSSGLFDEGMWEAAAIDTTAPIVVYNDWAAHFVNGEGRFPKRIYRGNNESVAGVEFENGWASAEADGRWTDGPEATATITVPGGTGKPGRISVTGNGWVPPNGPSQLIQLGVGRAPERWTELHFTSGAEIKTAEIELTSTNTSDNSITLHLRIQNPGRPSDYGDPDSRLLGFKFRTLGYFI